MAAKKKTAKKKTTKKVAKKTATKKTAAKKSTTTKKAITKKAITKSTKKAEPDAGGTADKIMSQLTSVAHATGLTLGGVEYMLPTAPEGTAEEELHKLLADGKVFLAGAGTYYATKDAAGDYCWLSGNPAVVASMPPPPPNPEQPADSEPVQTTLPLEAEATEEEATPDPMDAEDLPFWMEEAMTEEFLNETRKQTALLERIAAAVEGRAPAPAPQQAIAPTQVLPPAAQQAPPPQVAPPIPAQYTEAQQGAQPGNPGPVPAPAFGAPQQNGTPFPAPQTFGPPPGQQPPQQAMPPTQQPQGFGPPNLTNPGQQPPQQQGFGAPANGQGLPPPTTQPTQQGYQPPPPGQNPFAPQG